MPNATLEFYTAMGPKGDVIERPLVTREWITRICKDLRLDPKATREITITGTKVTVSTYAGGRPQADDAGNLLLAQDEFDVVG